MSGVVGPRSPVADALILLVRVYRSVPRLGPPRCRFYPTCSAYAIEALQVHGAMRGSLMAARRILRCHPFHPGGTDPVPPRAGGVGRAPTDLVKGSIRV